MLMSLLAKEMVYLPGSYQLYIHPQDSFIETGTMKMKL